MKTIDYIDANDKLRSAHLVQEIKKGKLAGGAIVRYFNGKLKTIEPEKIRKRRNEKWVR